MTSHAAVAIIAGAGPGTGAAIARTFARKGFAVALLARTASKLQELEQQINAAGGTAASFPTDLSQSSELRATFAKIQERFPGPLKVTIMNQTGKWLVKPFLEMDEQEWMSIVMSRISAAFTLSQLALGAFEKHGTGGTLIFTGATAAMRGSAKFSPFATGSFAVRALAQSLAREFQPKGIHVAHALIDGIIETERTKSMMGDPTASAEQGNRLDPEEIAKAYLYLHEQAPSAWTHELDLRPRNEKW